MYYHSNCTAQSFGGFGTARKLVETILAADNSSLLELTIFGGLLIVRQSFVLCGTSHEIIMECVQLIYVSVLVVDHVILVWLL